MLVCLCCGVGSSAGLGLRWLRCVVHSAYEAVGQRLQAVTIPPQAIPLQWVRMPQYCGRCT